MVKLFFILLLISLNAFSQEGVVVVLEAPLFKVPDQNTLVVQYLRKGDKIYIHPSELARDKYDGVIDETRGDVLKYDDNHAKMYPDKLFSKGETYFPDPGSKFYKTLSKNGADAYILKEHVYLLYKDMRELDQKVAKKDPTDYRIEEPLPKNYPLAQETGYRGQYLFSLGTPSTTSYPYTESIRDTGFDYNKELIIVWNRQVEWDVTRRFFFGGTFYFHSSNIEHTTKNITASENVFRIGAGPYLAYDIWRTEKYAINFFGAITFNFYDNIEIKQRITTEEINPQTLSDSREYKSMHFSSRLGTQVFVREFLYELDLILGANINLELPHTYTAYTNPDYDEYWEDSFQKGWSVQQSYFVGLQVDY